MKKFSQINEAKQPSKRSIFVNKKVVDIQYNVSDNFNELVMKYVREKGGNRSNHSYVNYMW